MAEIARLALTEDELQRFSKEAEEIFKLLERVKNYVKDWEKEAEIDETASVRPDKTEEHDYPILKTFGRIKERYLVVPRNL